MAIAGQCRPAPRTKTQKGWIIQVRWADQRQRNPPSYFLSLGGLRLRLNPPFCNGRWFVNPFLRYPFARHSLLYGVGARPPPDGVLRGTGRPIYLRVVAMPLGGLRSDLIHRPGEGLRFGKAGVKTRPKPVETLLLSCRRCGKVERLGVGQHAMHDDRQLAGQRHFR